MDFFGKVGSRGVERIGGAEQGAEIEAGEVSGSGFAAGIGGGLPERVGLGGTAAKSGEARVEIGLLLRPIGLRPSATAAAARIEVEGMDRLVIAIHLLDDFGQALLEIDPVGGVLLNAGGVVRGRWCGAAARARAGPRPWRDRRGGSAFSSAVSCSISREADWRSPADWPSTHGPGLAGGDGAVELGLGLELAGDLVLRGAEGGLRAGEGGALGIDAGAQVARQAVHAGEGKHGHHRDDEGRKELHGTFVVHGVTPAISGTRSHRPGEFR